MTQPTTTQPNRRSNHGCWPGVMALALALGVAGAAVAGEKKDKKKDDFSKIDRYTRMLKESNYIPLGPYVIFLTRDGKQIKGRVSVAIEADSAKAKGTLKNNKQAIDGMLYPIAARLFEDGSPTPSHFEYFKNEAMAKLKHRFPLEVKEIFIKDVMG